MAFLGHNYIQTWNVSVDIKNKQCTRTETSGATVVTTVADFSLYDQFCYGKFYYPLWLNNFSIDETTAHEWIDNDTSGKIAVLDVKNNKCYIKNQADLCDLTNTPTNANTVNEDVTYTCDCKTNPSETEYLFSKKYESNLNFVYMGYKYIELTNDKIFEGETKLSQVLNVDPLTI